MCKKEDLHIALLKYGKDRLESGVTFKELYAYIEVQGYEVSEDRMKAYFSDNYEPIDRKERGNPGNAIDKDLKFSLSVESTFRLIEYEEFKSANKNSRTATGFATAALVVSIVSALASVCFAIKQINTATTINRDQLTEILQLRYDDKRINLKADEIIRNQNLLIKEIKKNESKLKLTKKPNKTTPDSADTPFPSP